jgi:hypothetical protein
VLIEFFKEFVPHFTMLVVNIIFSMIGALSFEWRTGLTSFALIPLIIIAQTIQLSFVMGFT